MHFGDHVTLDGYGGDPNFLNSRERVLSCLTTLREELDMHALTEPVIVEAFDNEVKDPGGWSGFVIIAESHIALHTFPKRRFVSADVYTCKNGLDVNIIVDFFKKTFALEEVETHFIERGQHYPQHNLI